jgi:sigma-E factor negative regulatory protein RseA
MIREQVSALADGRLRGDELAEAIDRVGVDEEARAAWRTYHLVGDVLRSGVHAPCGDTSAFLARFQARLAAEPPPERPVTPPEVAARRPRAQAANEPVFRWRLAAVVASLVAVIAIGQSWVGVENAPVFAAAPQPVPVNDRQLVELLEAHWQVGGASQMPSEFLRNATYDQYSR